MTKKHLLNKIIDEFVHGNKPCTSVEQVVLDECLHALVEGGFKPEKFLRYQIMPQLRRKSKRRRR